MPGRFPLFWGIFDLIVRVKSKHRILACMHSRFDTAHGWFIDSYYHVVEESWKCVKNEMTLGIFSILQSF